MSTPGISGSAQFQKQKASGAQVTAAAAFNPRETAWELVQNCTHTGLTLFSSGPMTDYVYLRSEPLLI